MAGGRVEDLEYVLTDTGREQAKAKDDHWQRIPCASQPSMKVQNVWELHGCIPARSYSNGR